MNEPRYLSTYTTTYYGHLHFIMAHLSQNCNIVLRHGVILVCIICSSQNPCKLGSTTGEKRKATYLFSIIKRPFNILNFSVVAFNMNISNVGNVEIGHFFSSKNLCPGAKKVIFEIRSTGVSIDFLCTCVLGHTPTHPPHPHRALTVKAVRGMIREEHTLSVIRSMRK